MEPLVTAVIIGGVAYELVHRDVPVVPPLPLPGYSSSDYLSDSGQATWGGHLDDPDAQPKLDLLQQSAQAAFTAMDAVGRQAAADQLNNTLNPPPDPPLNGNDSWETVARVAGGAGGAAACSVTGVGAAVAPLCAMAGAYLGVKLEDWMQQEMPALRSWANGAISSVEDAVKDVGGWLNNIF